MCDSFPLRVLLSLFRKRCRWSCCCCCCFCYCWPRVGVRGCVLRAAVNVGGRCGVLWTGGWGGALARKMMMMDGCEVGGWAHHWCDDGSPKNATFLLDNPPPPSLSFTLQPPPFVGVCSGPPPLPPLGANPIHSFSTSHCCSHPLLRTRSRTRGQ